ncbi:MAG: hypothetical protein IMZ69_01835, partial [Spirochaetes bacterium]|nr:hypothetical protein [Spirochaetota bacterium]
ARGEKLFLNGEPLYIRGFGTDGNPNGKLRQQVTTVEGYRNYVKRAKEFGFNTMRSHMPDNDRPQAFLDATDELGLFIWAEFPMDPPDVSKLAPFWNHPSVIWWCWGNEIKRIGRRPWAKPAYEFTREVDPSRLVMDNSGWGEYDRPTTDLFGQHMGYYFGHGPRALFNSSYALWTAEGSMLGTSLADLMQQMRDGTFRLGKPMIAHETGNHQAFPDVRRRADRMNFSRRPDILKKMQLDNRMAHLDRWVEGSGKFKQAMDKLWMEQVRKSPLLEGYQMWMLADHGYVFAGVIEDGEDTRIKPFIDPQRFRVHNAPDVLLADFPDNNFKRVYLPGETFTLQLLASVYGPRDLPGGTAVWRMKDKGRVVASGEVPAGPAGRGGVWVLGDARVTTPRTATPLELQLEVELPHTEPRLTNEWNIWVVPETKGPARGKVLVVRDLSDSTMEALASGARVLLILEDTKAVERVDQPFASVLARFRPQIWEYGHNLGAYIPAHPAFTGFPHGGFSDLQFYRPIDYGRKIILDDCPFAPEPIVDAIDLPATSEAAEAYVRKASYLFELGVGQGSLLVTGFNFTDENLKHNEVRALLKALVDYASGPVFAPVKRVASTEFRDYVRKTKKSSILGERLWDKLFYADAELEGRNRFLDAGQEPPVVKAVPYTKGVKK